MGNWNKPKPPAGSVYVVMQIGDRYGVGIFRPDAQLERVKSIACKLDEGAVQLVVDRMNARNNVSKVEASELERNFRGTQAHTD